VCETAHDNDWDSVHAFEALASAANDVCCPLPLQSCRHENLTYKDLQPVLGHPAVLQLSSDDLEQLLLVALAKQDDQDVVLLCQHAAAANISPAAVGRLLVAAVQLNSSTRAVSGMLQLPRLDAVSMDDVLPAIRVAVCSSSDGSCRSSTHLQAIISSLHAQQPHFTASQVLPEALRMAVLLRSPQAVERVWKLGSSLKCQDTQQQQVAAVVVTALLCGNASAVKQVLGLCAAPSEVTIWQQLLTLALLARHREAALLLASECFRQQQLHEPWLPAVMRLAVAAGRAESTDTVQDSTDPTAVCCGTSAAASGTQEAATQQQQQQRQPLLQPRTVQDLLQLQGREREVFSDDCLQQVLQTMAAATCSSYACSSSSSAAACALQLLRFTKDPAVLQLLQSAVESMEAVATDTKAHKAADVDLLAELLQVAVVASNTHACRLLCSGSVSRHLLQQQAMHLLVLAVQLLHFSTPWQCQQRLVIMRSICKLFSSIAVASVQADAGSSSGLETKACVRQVLGSAVQLGDEEALQQLLALIPLQQQPLLGHTDLFVLQAIALRQARLSPRIMEMLCGLQLKLHSKESPAFDPATVEWLFDLLLQALETARCAKGIGRVVTALVEWQPRLQKAPLASQLDEDVVWHFVELALKITDPVEQALAGVELF
jgi:hypothetical protein